MVHKAAITLQLEKHSAVEEEIQSAMTLHGWLKRQRKRHRDPGRAAHPRPDSLWSMAKYIFSILKVKTFFFQEEELFNERGATHFLAFFLL